MTPGERQASGGLSATVSAPPPNGGPAAHPAPSRPGPSQEHSPPRASLWEDVFRGASPAQQTELLSLASRQGLLYAHQLPRGSNGKGTPTTADDARGLQLLSRLLHGQVADLVPSCAAPVDVHDTALDGRQREAVARALASPDLCLIQGLPGTGKSRVVAEIVTRAAARGDRVLLVGAGAAGVDRVLELVAGRDVLCPLRCVGKDERYEELPPAARAATFRERVRALKENALTAAMSAREQAEQRCQQLRQEEAVWSRLAESAAQHQRLLEEAQALQARRTQAPAEVEQAALHCAEAPGEAPAGGTFAEGLLEAATAHREALARFDAVRAEAERQQAERKQELDALSAQVEALSPLVDAKTRGRWWSPAWWRATFQGDVPAKLASLRGELETAQATLPALEKQLEDVARQRQAADEDYQKDRGRRVSEETARRVAELAEQLSALGAKVHALEDDWRQACSVLAQEKVRPAGMTAEAVGVARELWKVQQKEDEQRCTFAQQWAAYLEESADGLSARLPGYANLVATPIAALSLDEHFGDAAAAGGQFDLLVLEEAETLAEAELLRLARRARRWVLVGEPVAAAAPESRGEAARPRGRPRASSSPSSLARANVFHRLWQTLHCDPTRLPYAWVEEQDRLCCRLRQLSPEQRQWLESERVADFPEIELRILALPRVRPLLAEVVFPPSMTIEQAKGYIYQELQELPVQAAERSLHWADEPDRLALCLCPAGTGREAAVTLEPGVREVVTGAAESGTGAPWYTRRVEFERGAGWDRQRAEEWLHARLNLRDLGRTALLEAPHRMTPDLAAVVSDVLFEGGYRLPLDDVPHGADGDGEAAVEFVVVPPAPRRKDQSPPPREQDRKKRDAVPVRPMANSAPAAALPRAGAGLEQDLAVARHGDRLPTDLRAELPRQGLVNYLEAQAVVRKLEELAGEGTGSQGSVAVIALYPAQAELIRRLIARSPRLSAGGLCVEVDAPTAFRQREHDVVLVSLTRSHSHRAVAYGDESALLALALTRARARLIVFGDAGTLARRGQWDGVLDHLDEAAAAREGQVIGQLLSYLQGRGRHARAFRLSEGGSP